jgi:GT2 family glycosyltransferase
LKKLSIVIVNYNTKILLHQCLSSLYDQKHPFSFDVIVVDNNSNDGSVDMVMEIFPHVYLIENKENMGFARANNTGLKMARGEHVFLLNSDTKMIADALDKLVDFLDRHKEAAVVSPRVIYPDFSDQGVARTFPTPINALFGRRTILTRLFPNNRYSKKYLVSRRHGSNEPFQVDWVSGACLMVRRKIIEEIGYLDEKFFMYWEDADLCYRIKQRGWRIYCVPQAKVIHYEGKSSHTKLSNRLIIEFNKSVYRYYRKHHIKRFFDFKNVVAIFGLTLRTIVLLGINMISHLLRPIGKKPSLRES